MSSQEPPIETTAPSVDDSTQPRSMCKLQFKNESARAPVSVKWVNTALFDGQHE